MEGSQIGVECFKNTLENIFPELKESEDERIKTAILNHLKKMWGNSQDDVCGIHVEDAIAWLEKQDIFSKKDVDDAYLKGVSDTKNEIEKQYEANYQIRKDIATFLFNYNGDIKDRAKWMNYLGIKVSFVEKQGKKPQGKTALEAVNDINDKGYCCIVKSQDKSVLEARTDNELVEEVYSHLDSIKETADRMTNGNFMHNKAAIKFSANTITKVLELIGIKAQKDSKYDNKNCVKPTDEPKFKEGIEWADEHPNISEEEQVGMGGLGMMWQKKAFIEKAVTWLNNYFIAHDEYGIISYSFDTEEEMFEDFKKYMEE